MCVIRLCSFLLNAALGTTPHSKLLNPSPSFSLPPIAHYFFFLLVWKVFDELPLFSFLNNCIPHQICYWAFKKNLNKSTLLIILSILNFLYITHYIWKISYCIEKIMQINLGNYNFFVCILFASLNVCNHLLHSPATMLRATLV